MNPGNIPPGDKVQVVKIWTGAVPCHQDKQRWRHLTFLKSRKFTSSEFHLIALKIIKITSIIFSMVAIVCVWNQCCSSWLCDIITPVTERSSLAADTWPRKATVCVATMTFCHVSDVYHLQLSAKRHAPAAKATVFRSSAQTHIPWTCVAALTKEFPPCRKRAACLLLLCRCGAVERREPCQWITEVEKESSCLRGKELMNKVRSWQTKAKNQTAERQ